MINAVGMNMPGIRNLKQSTQEKPETTTTPITTTSPYTPKTSMAIRNNAMANINFGNAANSKAVIEDYQTYIRNIFAAKKPIIIEATGAGGQNAPLAIDNFYNTQSKKREYHVYSDSLKQPAMKITKTTDKKVLPEVRVKTGKFAPMAEIIDREIGIRIQVLPGSSAETPDVFSIVNPGIVRTGNEEKTISFKGKGEAQVVVYNKEDKVYQAAETYAGKGLADKVERGDFVETIQTDKPTFMVLAGGYGTRLYDYTDCKPAAKLPTDPSYSLMGNALDQIAKAGYLDKAADTKHPFIYLTGKGTLDGANVRSNIQQVNLGDGGCIAKALATGSTATDSPLIILNADTVTNADITRAYEAYKQNTDAAILIPYYEAPESRAKDFGLMAANPLDNGTLEIKSFVEKPSTLKLAEPAKVEGKNKYMANPGIYIIGPEALKRLKAMGKDLLSNPKEIGLAKNFITPLVEDCQKGTFLNSKGEPMKCYTALLEKKGGGAAYWDDLGKDYTIPETFRLMAKETVEHKDTPENLFYGLPKFLLDDAVKNVDLNTGVTFMNEAAREKFAKFKAKYGATLLIGNCIVYDSVA